MQHAHPTEMTKIVRQLYSHAVIHSAMTIENGVFVVNVPLQELANVLI